MEANAVSSVRSVGWRADTFSVGDQVSVRGFPHREPNRNTLFVDVITKADGSSYRSSGLAPGSFQAPEAPVGGSTDFSGVWQPDFASRNVAAGFRPDSLPLTASAQAVLVIDTRHFEETVWGLDRGTPSGTQKHLVERYALSDDGMRLDVEYWFEDPEFMTEAVTVSGGEMFLKPGYEFEAWDCDAEAARRHLAVE